MIDCLRCFVNCDFFKDIFHSYFSVKHLLSQEIAEECQDMNWGTFKPLLTDALVDHLHPIQVLATHFFWL